ncbi:MAG: SMI1/KNR4 family protein [Enhygromyxa sp.]
MQQSADEQLQQAIDDIKEWLRDNDAESFIGQLAPGARAADLDELEAALGAALPAGLRQLYLLHDGQTGEIEPLFEHMRFLSVAEAAGSRAGMLDRYVIPPAGVALRDYHARHDYVSDAELLSPRWLPFANTEGDFLAVQLDTGRVYRFSKGDLPWIHLEAPDFATFIGDYASAIWDDVYQFHGDPARPGVEDGLRWLGRYLSRA